MKLRLSTPVLLVLLALALFAIADKPKAKARPAAPVAPKPPHARPMAESAQQRADERIRRMNESRRESRSEFARSLRQERAQ